MVALGSVLVREARPSTVGFKFMLLCGCYPVATVMKQTSQAFFETIS